MGKELRKQPYLLYKKDIPRMLNYASMRTVYKKVLTENIVQELGFDSMDEFKRIKIFNLDQSRALKQFIKNLLNQ